LNPRLITNVAIDPATNPANAERTILVTMNST
jgi:hypothetical protein